MRKKLFQDALVAITLPHIKKNLAAVCKPELRRLEQSVDVDHAHFVHAENVYESILLQTLDKEVTRGELLLVVRLDQSLETCCPLLHVL